MEITLLSIFARHITCTTMEKNIPFSKSLNVRVENLLGMYVKFLKDHNSNLRKNNKRKWF